jgi:hypothetical protein
MKILGKYKNGNYQVIILADGTKIRFNNEDHLTPDFPESMDIKITNQCNMGCPYCHEDSTPYGAHAGILHAGFIETLHPYTELAIGGGNPLSHPDLEGFLIKCKVLKLIPSVTVNQVHFMQDYDKIKHLCDSNLIYGLGISLTQPTDEFINLVQTIPNAVIHVIAGVTPNKDIEILSDHPNLKILILGYKNFRRGTQYQKENLSRINHRIFSLKKKLPVLARKFQVTSFDNLAVKQLSVRDILTDEQWEQFYMGDDGKFTMYVDLVNQVYAVSSTSTERYPLLDDIQPMFKKIRDSVN